jgi:hypothetical protein
MSSIAAMRCRTSQRRRRDSNARQIWSRAAYQRRTLPTLSRESPRTNWAILEGVLK